MVKGRRDLRNNGFISLLPYREFEIVKNVRRGSPRCGAVLFGALRCGAERGGVMQRWNVCVFCGLCLSCVHGLCVRECVLEAVRLLRLLLP